MADDIIYRYELSNGKVYVGRDKVGKYKRAVDHMQNALYVAFKNDTKRSNIFHSVFFTYSFQFAFVKPQFFEEQWGNLINQILSSGGNSEDKKTNFINKIVGNYNSNEDFDYIFTNRNKKQRVVGLSSYTDDFKNQENKVSTSSSFNISKQELGLGSWSYLHAKNYLNTLSFNFHGNTYSFKEMFPSNFWNTTLSDDANMSEFLLTCREYNLQGTANNLLNKEAGDFPSFYTAIANDNINYIEKNNVWQDKINTAASDIIINTLTKKLQTSEKLNKTGKKSGSKVVKSVKTTKKELDSGQIPLSVPTAEVKKDLKNIINQIISENKNKPRWIDDTQNMVRWVIKNISYNKQIIDKASNGMDQSVLLNWMSLINDYKDYVKTYAEDYQYMFENPSVSKSKLQFKKEYDISSALNWYGDGEFINNIFEDIQRNNNHSKSIQHFLDYFGF